MNSSPAHAGKSSGMSPSAVLESQQDVDCVWRLGHALDGAQTPEANVDVLRVERRTAFKKATGGVRGTVVADMLTRLIARTLAW